MCNSLRYVMFSFWRCAYICGGCQFWNWISTKPAGVCSVTRERNEVLWVHHKISMLSTKCIKFSIYINTQTQIAKDKWLWGCHAMDAFVLNVSEFTNPTNQYHAKDTVTRKVTVEKGFVESQQLWYQGDTKHHILINIYNWNRRKHHKICPNSRNEIIQHFREFCAKSNQYLWNVNIFNCIYA